MTWKSGNKRSCVSRGSRVAPEAATRCVSRLFSGRLLPIDYLQELCGLEGRMMGTAALKGMRESNLT